MQGCLTDQERRRAAGEYLAKSQTFREQVYSLSFVIRTFLADIKAREGSSRFHNFEWLVKQLESEGSGEGNPAEFEELAVEEGDAPVPGGCRRSVEPARVEPVRTEYSGTLAVGLIAATFLYTLFTHRGRRE